MDEKRKKLLCDILAEADKMRIEKTWLVSEDELEEHSGIRDSYEFGFLCGYLHCREQMVKNAVEAEVQWHDGFLLMYDEHEVEDLLLPDIKVGDKVRLAVIKED